ncbi:receptor-like protein 2 [Phragmites australis]|uniref:receptor-like protein 2 n=1 Tax=Phragmites australis TaxID=29695 RepID=UPI002D76BB98|nr:receptor-like protein 2 [Phragmites australis]
MRFCKKFSNGFPTPFLGLSLALLLFAFLQPTSSCTEQEKSCLLQFLAGLSQDGGLALSWQNGTHCCTWEGVACGADGTVTDVSLTSKGLEGHISASLGELTGLLRINLSHNMLSGGLPLELMSSNSIVVLDVSFNRLNGDLRELPSSTPGRPLQVFNISSNLFTGQFPSKTWEVMNSLVALNASNNSFTGQIPSHFCSSSPGLTVIALCYNQLSGSIPPELGNCSMLKVLKAGHNNLTGPLPGELFSATSLEYLSFPNNGLQGILDGARIINLRNLETLDLGGNNFTGRIPNDIGQLRRLKKLRLGRNKLSEELPSSLGSCTNLRTIDLGSNNFSGELAKVKFSNLHNLKTLDLLYNNFTGTIPESIYSCRNLTALRLSGNNLQGQLSPQIGNLKSLTFLSLGQNNFTNITNTLQILKSCRNLTTLLITVNFMHETMPNDDSIDGFENLQVLDLGGCSLLGKIPHWLSKLTNLEMLFLDNNQLSGPIPDWISSLNYLFSLDISNNSLTGEIPEALTEMPMLKSAKTAARLDPTIFELPIYVDASLQYRKASAFPKALNLGNNDFTGVIPPEIGLLKGLHALNLSFNKLHGDIPQSICNLTNLLVLDLSNNHLAGAIPAALINLHFLSKFNVSFNDLEGPVPTTGQFSTFTNSSFDGNPKLCGPMFNHHCNSAEAGPVSTLSKEQTYEKVVFASAFGAFFAVGVLYDQIVLSRYFLASAI